MKSIITLLILPLLFISTFSIAQCPDYTADLSGSITINIYSETGECFKVSIQGSDITPESTSNLTFKVNKTTKVKVNLDNGNIIEKNILLNPDMVSVFFAVQQNKKGKWSLKNKFGKMEKTAASQKAWDDKLAANKAEMDAKKAKSDAEWDAARQAEKDDRDARKIEDDKEQAKKDAEREARYDAQRKNEEAVRPKNDLEERKAEQEKLRIAEEKEREEAKRKAEISKTTTQSTTSTSTTTSTSPTTSPSTVKPSSGSTSVPMIVTYKGVPVTDTYITLEIEKVVIGSSTTDNNGRAVIKTNLPVNTEVAYKLSGKKGNAKWSFSGIFLLERAPKETKVPLDYAIKIMAEEIGMPASSIASSWGLQ